MKINAEYIFDLYKNTAMMLYSSLYGEDEKDIVTEALEDYTYKKIIPFNKRMLAGRIIESIEAAENNHTEIRVNDIGEFLRHKKYGFDTEIDKDLYAAKNEGKSDETQKKE